MPAVAKAMAGAAVRGRTKRKSSCGAFEWWGQIVRESRVGRVRFTHGLDISKKTTWNSSGLVYFLQSVGESNLIYYCLNINALRSNPIKRSRILPLFRLFERTCHHEVKEFSIVSRHLKSFISIRPISRVNWMDRYQLFISLSIFQD